jgi:hypothetical protein
MKMNKVSDQLYKINAHISLKYIGLKHKMSYNEIVALNAMLAGIIKSIRSLEEELELSKR